MPKEGVDLPANSACHTVLALKALRRAKARVLGGVALTREP